jgi:hypothetical protein
MIIGPDCERLLVDYFELTRLRTGRTLRFSLQYQRQITPPCRTNLTVTRATRRVATKSIRAPDFRLHRVTVPQRDPGGGPLRLVFRTAENCDTRSGGPVRGGFMINRPVNLNADR